MITLYRLTVSVRLLCVAVNGQWVGTSEYETIVDPLNGEAFMTVAATKVRSICCGCVILSRSGENVL